MKFHIAQFQRDRALSTKALIIQLYAIYPGITQKQIANFMQLSPETVGRYVRAIRKEWREAYARDLTKYQENLRARSGQSDL
jgi:transcriptional antiterminator